MSITFAQLQTILQTDIADASDSTFTTQALNIAQRRVARARRWPELMTRAFFNTVAAYSTGTVALANGATTVTLTDGTFPTDLATGTKYRFALGTDEPWYAVDTRTSGTEMEIADAYVDDTVTASSYIVYKSHYSLAAAVDRVEEIWLHDGGTAVPLQPASTDERVSEFIHYPSGPGVPTHFYNMERDSSGDRQILLGPETPDDIYRVEYVYRKQTTDGTYSLDESRWPIVMALAKSLAYEATQYERSMAEYRKYKMLLREEWADTSESEQKDIEIGRTRYVYPHYDDRDDYIRRGVVADPTL